MLLQVLSDPESADDLWDSDRKPKTLTAKRRHFTTARETFLLASDCALSYFEFPQASQLTGNTAEVS